MGTCTCICKKTDQQSEILSENQNLAIRVEIPGDSTTFNSNIPIPEGSIFFEDSQNINLDKPVLLIKTQSLIRGFLKRKEYQTYILRSKNKFLIDFASIDSNLLSKETIKKHSLSRFFNFPLKPSLNFRTLFKLQNGIYYQGEVNEKQEPEGYGSMIFSDGSLYEGQWIQGKMEGLGRIITADADLFEGTFVDNKLTGKMEYNNGSLFEGEFLYDMPHGFGKEILEDKTEYIGQYHYGLKNGLGKSSWPDGSYYEGNFENDLYEGFGKYLWVDKEYEGEWAKGKMHGKGTFKWNDGKVYSGDYFEGIKQGFGVFIWPDGKKYEGYWVGGKQDGEGVLYSKATAKRGLWKNGKLIEKLKNTKSEN